MADTCSPLIAAYHAERVLAWRSGAPVTAAAALLDIRAVAATLTGRSAFFNLCDDRYLFTVAFAAGCCAGSVNLLPQTRQGGVLESIVRDYGDAVIVDDAWVDACLAEAGSAPVTVPDIPAAREVAVVFTSGSTGRPEPQPKRWGDLARGSQLLCRRFFPDLETANIVASVPPQHMYGLESSVLLALHAGFAADSDRPFMPWQMTAALARLPEPRILFTTPLQLRACLKTDVELPKVASIVSAAAPLAPELAAAVEQRWRTRVHEIYGSSETGSMASRRTAVTGDWRLYDGLQLTTSAGTVVSGGQLPEPVALDDRLTVLDSMHFRLLGRADDLLKVAGKRLSLAELDSVLRSLEGVEDAAVFMPPGHGAVKRPAALVVAPQCRRRDLRAALARRVDPVFVPRPMLQVDHLPRNAMGKLARADLLAMWQRIGGTNGNG